METNQEVLDANIGENTYKVEIELIDSSKFIILFFASFGLYGIWWMYKTWDFFKKKDNLDIMPAARALFAIFFLYGLFEEIKSFARSNGYTGDYSSTGLFMGIIILNMASQFLPEPFFVVAFLAFIFYLQPFNAFNFAVENSQMYNVKSGGFNIRQIVLLVAGGLMWTLMIIGIVM
jgi:hypothetical protein